MLIRNLIQSDIDVIVSAFDKSNWTTKSKELFKKYLDEQSKDERIVLVAYYESKFAGYVTLRWLSLYPKFVKNNIPEICDLNVLPKFRNLRIGTSLLENIERLAATRSNTVGIGFGLYADYGSAQRIYVKRGYIPDGFGITYNYKQVIPGKEYQVDDDLVLWFTKQL